MREPFIFLSSEITRENALTLMAWLEDENVTRYLSDSQNVSKAIEQTISRINLPVLTHLFNQDGRFFMAYDKQNAPVGFVRLVKKGADYEMILVIGDSNNWGKKLGTGTIRESMKIAFFELRAGKLIAKIHAENKRSVRAFQSCGFLPESETPTLKVFTITIDRYLKSLKRKPAASEIYITEIDKSRLKDLIYIEQNSKKSQNPSLKELEGEIERAVVVNPRQISRDVVTMNSRALLHLDDEEMEISLVYPRDADWNTQKVSICSPIGTAILGYKEGDVIDWQVPDGTMKIHIEKVLYQPEAAGDFHL